MNKPTRLELEILPLAVELIGQLEKEAALAWDELLLARSACKEAEQRWSYAQNRYVKLQDLAKWLPEPEKGGAT